MSDDEYQKLIAYATDGMTDLEKACYEPPFPQYGAFSSALALAVSHGQMNLGIKIAKELFGKKEAFNG